jgi:tRNA pseudouridine55 synthase
VSPTSTSGILLVDKQGGMTSHDVVGRVRRIAGTRKVGHAGTLDPMATGLLVLGLNSSTRLLTFLVGLDKQYVATIRLGQTTDTDDAEGSVTAETDAAAVTEDAVRTALAAFLGRISQVPSSVSAIKVDGRRAYDRVRDGEVVELAAREVTISAIDVLAVRPGRVADVDVVVDCSSGTYIRAIARDLGTALGVGGHLTALRRTRVGPFAVDDGVVLPDRGDDSRDDEVMAALRSPASVASAVLPTRELTPVETRELVYGRRIPLADSPPGVPIAAITAEGVLVGIVESRGEQLRPIANFPTDEVRA